MKDDIEQIGKVAIWGAIFGAALVVAILIQEHETVPLEQVQWTVSERCVVIHGVPCEPR